MSKYGTSFNESEVFLAATERDIVEINQLFGQMSVGEIRRLREASRYLMVLCSSRIRGLERGRNSVFPIEVKDGP